MHDLDRTLRTYESEAGGDWELGEELETFDHEGPFPESEEMELAAELLSLESEEELDQFLGKLFKKVGGVKGIFKSLGTVLKPIAKAALPIVGKVAGSFFGGPVGGAIGGKLGTFASKLFEMELEGMDPGQQEMEVARRVVRLAGTAAQNAASAPAAASPMATAKAAVASAAQMHAPGLLRGRFGRRLTGGGSSYGPSPYPSLPGNPRRCRQKSGAWIRRGGKVILLGA
ncbi:MAG: hypothetical protein ACJ76J_12255 [Thermoanaerobaculia bacterium]